MRKKNLLNTSEFKTISELKESLSGTGYSVYPEIQLNNILSIEADDSLTKKEKQALNTASFDFVIFNSENMPEFAVEFDGPCHSKYQKKKEADFRKNKLCSLASLPLLRIDDSFLTKYEGLSFLNFVVSRFLAWQNDMPLISKEIEERLSYTKEIDFDDPFNDPTIIFDLKHPFPALIKLATKLYSDSRVVTSYLSDTLYCEETSKLPYIEFRRNKFGGWPIDNNNRIVERGYLLKKHFIGSVGKYATEHIHDISVSVSYNWRLPTSNKNDLSISYFQGLPGITMGQVADNLCDYIALKKIEEWFQKKSNL